MTHHFKRVEKIKAKVKGINLLCFLPDLVDGGTGFSDDKLVELLEDVHLDLIVRFQQFLVLLGHLLSTLVHVLLGSTEFDNVGLLTDVREGDLNTRIAAIKL